jgi:hypothetical protein
MYISSPSYTFTLSGNKGPTHSKESIKLIAFAPFDKRQIRQAGLDWSKLIPPTPSPSKAAASNARNLRGNRQVFGLTGISAGPPCFYRPPLPSFYLRVKTKLG